MPGPRNPPVSPDQVVLSWLEQVSIQQRSLSADELVQMTHSDPVDEALEVVLEAVAQSQRRMALIGTRAGEIRRRRAQGQGYAVIVALEDRPFVVELLSDTIVLLHDASGPFRRAEAGALHAEGVTMDRIASLFGVTRQRVSEILRTRPKAGPR
jgi:hypothetical protein